MVLYNPLRKHLAKILYNSPSTFCTNFD